MLHLKFQANVFGLCLLQGTCIFSKSISLTSSETNVDVNTSLTLTCTYIGYGEVSGTQWDINNKHAPYIVRSQDDICTCYGIFTNDTIYRVGCPSTSSFTVTILRVQLEDHNGSWRCFDRERSSNTVTVFVKVPVVHVILTLSDTSSNVMKEHSRQRINCRTSSSRPKPKVNWYLQESTGSEKHKLVVNSSTTVVSSSGDGREAVESTLFFYPNRSINGWMLYCEGWTENENRSVHSNKLTMNIAYPPNNPPKIDGFDDNRKYRLIESEVGKLVCSVYGGNPLPKLTWNCYNDTQFPDTTDGKTVTKSVTWIGTRGQTSCSCTSTHSMPGTTMSTNISLNILFPSEIKTFSLSSKRSEEGTAVLNETDNATIVCLAEANPSSNLTIENRRFGVISEASDANIIQHSFHNVSYIDAGEYTCRGRNAYTSGLSASSHLILIVKCPPRPSPDNGSVVTVTTVMSVDVILSFSAWMYMDVPNKTIFKWFRGNELISENDKTYIIRSEELQTNLSILNTTDQDLGLYRVSVRNSVGEYNHYYVLNAAVRTERPTDVVCSSNTGAFIIVGAGTFLFTLMMVVFSVCGYNLLMKHKFSNRKSHKHGDIHGHRLSVTEGSQCPSFYTDLDVKKKESNEYDAVNIQGTSSEQQDLSIQGTSAYIKMKDAKDLTKDTLDYINIKI